MNEVRKELPLEIEKVIQKNFISQILIKDLAVLLRYVVTALNLIPLTS
jgi:hypothetical protein